MAALMTGVELVDCNGSLDDDLPLIVGDRLFVELGVEAKDEGLALTTATGNRG